MNKVLKTLSLPLVSLSISFGASDLDAQQRHPPHSLSLGLISGVAEVSHHELNAALLGLNFHHQRNFTAWFSLRSGFTFNYILPSKIVTRFPIGQTGSIVVDQGISTYQYLQGTLSFMPMLYYREKNFNLFAGVAAGLGYLVSKLDYDEDVIYVETGARERVDAGNRSDSFLNFGYRPTAGVGFNLHGDRSGGEIEIAFSYGSWYGHPAMAYSEDYTAFGIQTSYKYNFER